MATGKPGVTSSSRKISPRRYMQLALATLVLFALAFMYEFVSMTTSLRSTEDFEVEKGSEMVQVPMHGHSVVYLQGFDDGYKFVSEFNVEKQGPLYIFVMSDVDRSGTYWCPDCERARKPVMDAFNRSSKGSTLAEIRVGPPAYWKDSMNDFRQNELFYLDHIPTLMRYEGGGNSSAMLTESFCTDTGLLDYTFRVDQPLAGEAKKNKVLTMSSSADVIDYLEMYDNSYPLFLYFISGYYEFNGRLWCPYCDQADVAVMHCYNYTALDDAVMVRVTVADTYEQWKQETNPFKSPEFQEKVAPIRGVPFLSFVTKDILAKKVQVHKFLSDYKEAERLETFFTNDPRTTRPKGE